nr:MAG TPA: hypothetical protein [Caudoviricetes sp.]
MHNIFKYLLSLSKAHLSGLFLFHRKVLQTSLWNKKALRASMHTNT